MAKNAFISITDVSKFYGSVQAVADVNLNIQEGEFFGLLGSSGSGKSTLLRIIGGFETISKGEVTIDNQPMMNVVPHLRPINTVFQSYAIFPHLNVFQNIAYGLRKEKLSKAELTKRVNTALELIQLPEFGDRRASQMSGGQRQRVALARAFVKQPKVLLLDEPMGALDKRLREHMQVELRALQKRLGITFIFVTHDQEEALTMCDRIAVMNEGRILEFGTPKQLYEHPRAHFTAQFLGEMNFFKVKILEITDSGGHVELQGLGKVHVDKEKLANLQNANGHAGIRPENLHLVTHGTTPEGNHCQGTIENQIYLGNRSNVNVKLEGLDEPILVSVPRHMADMIANLSVGDSVSLEWHEESLLTFSH